MKTRNTPRKAVKAHSWDATPDPKWFVPFFTYKRGRGRVRLREHVANRYALEFPTYAGMN